MAEHVEGHINHVKQVLEKEITCPLCLEIFRAPKKLPCDHVYCKKCLEGLVNRSFDTTISCPECRALTQVPNGNVDTFPTSFRLNRLVEAFQQVKIREEADSSIAAREAKCKQHPAQPIALFCVTCKELLCRDCVIVTKRHANHDYGFISDMKEKLQEKTLSRYQKWPIRGWT